MILRPASVGRFNKKKNTHIEPAEQREAQRLHRVCKRVERGRPGGINEHDDQEDDDLYDGDYRSSHRYVAWPGLEGRVVVFSAEEMQPQVNEKRATERHDERAGKQESIGADGYGQENEQDAQDDADDRRTMYCVENRLSRIRAGGSLSGA